MKNNSSILSALVIRALTVGLGLAFFLEQTGLQQALTQAAPGSADFLTWPNLLGLVAPVFYMWSVWAASNVFIRINHGAPFGQSVVRGMNQMGAGLMLGAWSTVLLEPAMLHLIANDFREMRGVKLDYTVENLTVAIVGLALVMLAKEGRKIRSTLDQFV